MPACRTSTNLNGLVPVRWAKGASTMTSVATVLTPMAFVPAIVTIAVSAFAFTIVPTMCSITIVFMLLSIAALNPVFAHEVHRLSAGVVAGTVPAPILLVFARNVQIDRPLMNRHGARLDDHWLRIDHGGLRVVADVNATVDAGLIDANRDADIGPRERRSRGAGGQNESKFLQGCSPRVCSSITQDRLPRRHVR